MNVGRHREEKTQFCDAYLFPLLPSKDLEYISILKDLRRRDCELSEAERKSTYFQTDLSRCCLRAPQVTAIRRGQITLPRDFTFRLAAASLRSASLCFANFIERAISSVYHLTASQLLIPSTHACIHITHSHVYILHTHALTVREIYIYL